MTIEEAKEWIDKQEKAVLSDVYYSVLDDMVDEYISEELYADILNYLDELEYFDFGCMDNEGDSSYSEESTYIIRSLIWTKFEQQILAYGYKKENVNYNNFFDIMRYKEEFLLQIFARESSPETSGKETCCVTGATLCAVPGYDASILEELNYMTSPLTSAEIAYLELVGYNIHDSTRKELKRKFIQVVKRDMKFKEVKDGK
jgi:hypothetical protein